VEQASDVINALRVGGIAVYPLGVLTVISFVIVIDKIFLLFIRARLPPWLRSSASIRSHRVSPMPISSPVVKGTAAAPAASSMSRRTFGSLSGEPKCRPPRFASRSETVSNMAP
jgi:hypothetical protein